MNLFDYDENKGLLKVTLPKNFTKNTINKEFETAIFAQKFLPKKIIVDFGNCSLFDSAGAIELKRFCSIFTNNPQIQYENQNENQKQILEFYNKNYAKLTSNTKPYNHFFDSAKLQIKATIIGWFGFFSFVGLIFEELLKTIIHPSRFRFRSFLTHIDNAIIQAIGIVALLSFLIGLVVAFQSSQYLVKIGGDIFIVDLAVMSVFRELSPMITAIIVASRSASSFAAEIGTIKTTEEIDALKTMGFSPITFLVLPRVMALFVALPLLFFIADMAGLFGTLIVAKFHLGITFIDFFERMYQEISITEFYVGFMRAPLYGAIIATIGCYRGFMVDASTQSIGIYTTKSVVDAIFWIIILDAIIAVMLTRIGI